MQGRIPQWRECCIRRTYYPVGLVQLNRSVRDGLHIGRCEDQEEGMGLKKDEEDITFVESVLGRNRDLAAQDAETTT